MQTSLLISLIVFLIFLVLVERLHSIKILIRFGLSLAVIYGYIRAIAEGKSIILFSFLLSLILTIINVFIKNGIYKKSFSELISVLITTLITSGTIYLICKNINPKIYQNEIMSFDGVKKPEDALCGIFMISTLGIYMDIISRIIFCLDNKKDKTIDVLWKDQFKQGIEVGRKMLSEKIDMIVLILLGVSLFPICLNINKEMGFSKMCNNPEIYAYFLIAIIANIGFLVAVLITAFIYACFNRKKTIYKTVSENKVDGKRSLKL